MRHWLTRSIVMPMVRANSVRAHDILARTRVVLARGGRGVRQRLLPLGTVAFALIIPLGVLGWSAFGGADRAKAAIAADNESAIDPAIHIAAFTTWEGQASVAGLSTLTREVRVKKGDSLMRVLTRAGIGRSEANDAIVALRKVYDPRRNLQIGDRLSFTFGPGDGTADNGADKNGGMRFLELILPLTYDKYVSVRRRDGIFKAQSVTRNIDRRLTRLGGEIRTNLFRDGAAAGIPAPVLSEFIRVFSFDIDFQRELRQGDRFELLFEQARDEFGEVVNNGEVVLAKLSVGGTELTFYRYETSKGHLDYFDAEGRSVRRSLMRTPVDGARLASGYGRRRDPILGYTRMHKGVDFAASRGTPVYAAGDGRIIQAGRNGAYGIYVRIRHNSTYQTAYAHMKGIAKGVNRGTRVKQGQVIGYVGSSGRSTGSHLHYEVHENGKAINPRRVKPRTGETLKGDELARFQDHLKTLQRQFAELGEKKPITVAKVCDVAMDIGATC